jgi:type IV secretory pathway TraG/TraD family ATPase VirD4
MVKEITKRIRKYNGNTVLGTQNIADLLVKSIREKTQPIISNANIKYLFYPGKDEMQRFSDLLKVSEEELSMISKSKRGHCLLFADDKKYYVEVKSMGYEKDLFGDAGGK